MANDNMPLSKEKASKPLTVFLFLFLSISCLIDLSKFELRKGNVLYYSDLNPFRHAKPSNPKTGTNMIKEKVASTNETS